MSKAHLDLLRQVVDLPTAPFVETHVVLFIERFVARRPALRLRRDRFGNLLVKYDPPGKAAAIARPLLFAAHMDHPGFVATRMLDHGRVQAEFLGGVQWPYFKDAKIQFYSGGKWVPAQIVKLIPPRDRTATARKAASSRRSFGISAPPETVIARVKAPIKPNSPGMWIF